MRKNHMKRMQRGAIAYAQATRETLPENDSARMFRKHNAVRLRTAATGDDAA